MTWYTHNFKGQRQDIDSLYKILEFSTLDFAGVFEPDKKLTPQEIVTPDGTVHARVFLGGGRLITNDGDVSLTLQDDVKIYCIRVRIDGDDLNIFDNKATANVVDTIIDTPDFFRLNFGMDISSDDFKPSVTYWGQTSGRENSFIIPLFKTDNKSIVDIYVKNVDKDEYLKYLSQDNYDRIIEFITNNCAPGMLPADSEGYYHLGDFIKFDNNGNLILPGYLAKDSWKNSTGGVVIVEGDESGKMKLWSKLPIKWGGTYADNKLDAKRNLGFKYGQTLPSTGEEGDVFFKIIE